jgi:hypothetical protein
MENMVVSDDVRCWSVAVNIVPDCDEVVPIDEGEGVWCSTSRGVGGTRRTEGAFMRAVRDEKKKSKKY